MRRHIIQRSISIGVAIAGSGATVLGQPRGVTGYEAISIPPLAGDVSTSMVAIDEFGRMVGESRGVFVAGCVWIDGQLVPLPLPPGSESVYVSGISPTSGVLVGYSRVNSVIRGVAWVIGTGIFVLDNLPGGSSACSAATANDLGQMVGSCSFPNRSSLWPRLDSPVDLGTLGGRGLEYALDINELGEIVGTSENGFGVPRPYLWRAGQMIDIGGEPYDVTAYGWGINNLGETVGYAVTRRTAFYWFDGRVIDLPDPYPCGSALSKARAINDGGLIVGEALGQDCFRLVPTIWEREAGFQPHLLGEYMPRQPELDLQQALDINDAGQIAAFGELPNGDGRGYLVTPYLFEMSDPVPGRAGTMNTITITGLLPNQRVLLAYGMCEGAQKIRPTCPGGTLLIRDPRTSPIVLADANGVATITINVPPSARGRTIRLQAIAPFECQISHTVTWTFE